MLGVRTKEWKHCKFSTNIVDIDTHPDIDSNHKAATDSLVCLNCQLWWFLHALVTDFRHDSLVMVSGGSGIAPFISIIREILFQGSKQKTEIPSILLVCAFRNSADLAMLELLLPISVNTTEISQNIKLQIEAYVTREEGQPKTDQNTQTIWFNPGPFDSPITAAIGPNSWLWLGAIITSSFFMFLLLLGIITRYHIYPIDHNTDMIYHFSYKCLWDMFLVCACSFTVATAGFVWHKRANAVEMKKIQNMEVRTPSASPGPVDRELESFPKQLFIEASNVHFGGRPDLKSMNNFVFLFLFFCLPLFCFHLFPFRPLVCRNNFSMPLTGIL